MTTKARYIFILTTGHSGGTLLNLLLGTHPKIFAAGESLRIARLANIGSQPTENREFWQAAIQRLENQGIDLSMLTEEYTTDAPLAFWEKWIAIMADISPAPIIADKTLSLKTIRRICDAGLVDPFFVHLARDPRAVCYSYQRKSRSIWQQARTYNKTHRSIEAYLAGKTNCIFTRYEDFVRRPTYEMGRIFTAIGDHYGLNLQDGMPDDLDHRSLDDAIFDNRIFAGNHMRKPESRKDSAIRHDLTYLDGLSQVQWLTATALCRAYLDKFDYPKSAASLRAKYSV